MKKIAMLIATGLFTVLFSMGAFADDPKMVQVTGKLIQIVAIGSETTGTAIETSDGQIIEVSLRGPSTLTPMVEVSEGDVIQVEGYYVTVVGIEIPQRQVLTVVSIKKVK